MAGKSLKSRGSFVRLVLGPNTVGPKAVESEDVELTPLKWGSDIAPLRADREVASDRDRVWERALVMAGVEAERAGGIPEAIARSSLNKNRAACALVRIITSSELRPLPASIAGRPLRVGLIVLRRCSNFSSAWSNCPWFIMITPML